MTTVQIRAGLWPPRSFTGLGGTLNSRYQNDRTRNGISPARNDNLRHLAAKKGERVVLENVMTVIFVRILWILYIWLWIPYIYSKYQNLITFSELIDINFSHSFVTVALCQLAYIFSNVMMLMDFSLGRCWMPNDPDCPGSRYTSEFPGVKYGIYVPFGCPKRWDMGGEYGRMEWVYGHSSKKHDVYCMYMYFCSRFICIGSDFVMIYFLDTIVFNVFIDGCHYMLIVYCYFAMKIHVHNICMYTVFLQCKTIKKYSLSENTHNKTLGILSHPNWEWFHGA